MQEKITVKIIIDKPVDKVWQAFTQPEHITGWNFANNDWHCPLAENDLRSGGKFNYRMEAKDGSVGFDLNGIFNEVVSTEKIVYTIGDGRQITVLFSEQNGQTTVEETFDAEMQNPVEMQRQGWQAILDNFKKYAESNL